MRWWHHETSCPITIGKENEVRVMTIELPTELELAITEQANARGVSAAGYVREVLERELAPALGPQPPGQPFKTSRGMWAKYGISLSAEDIDENRADMFRNFGEEF